MANLKTTTIDPSGYLKIPVGNTEDRPNNAIAGSIRFNTDFNKIEIWDGGSWVGGSFTFVDTFASDTISSYDIERSSGNPSTPFDWQSSSQVSVNSADNENCRISKDSGSNTYPTSGKITMTFQKTKDYPTDNSHGFYMYETDLNYYYVYFSGSSYQPSLRMFKYINGNVVDEITVNNAVDFDNQNRPFKFDYYYSPTRLEFYMDDVLVGSGTTNNNYAIVPVRATWLFAQVDGLLSRIGVEA